MVSIRYVATCMVVSRDGLASTSRTLARNLIEDKKGMNIGGGVDVNLV